LTHLIRVDLPDPDGPHTTTTSPFLTAVVQSVRTWKSPYHLLTDFIVIMGPVVSGACAVLSGVVMGRILGSDTAATRRRQRMMAIFFWRRRTAMEATKQTAK
jgi:hypothetical protein